MSSTKKKLTLVLVKRRRMSGPAVFNGDDTDREAGYF